MQKQSAASKLSSLTLSGFLSAVQKNVDADNALAIKRYMQKGMFEELWYRARKNNDITASVTYANVGHLTQRLLGGTKPSSAFKKELVIKPVTGFIRARQEIHDDIRFVLTVVSNDVCLMLDNAALDSRMATVMVYDAAIATFVNRDDALIDFVLSEEVKM